MTLVLSLAAPRPDLGLPHPIVAIPTDNYRAIFYSEGDRMPYLSVDLGPSRPSLALIAEAKTLPRPAEYRYLGTRNANSWTE